jgi:hypothetical protein
MAANPRDFARENIDRVTEAASSGANWMAQFSDFNLRQSMAALDSMLTMAHRAAEGFSQQAATMREHAVALAEQAVENTSEFSNRMVHLKDPLEWTQVQSEYLSRQARAFAEGNRKLGEALIREQGAMAGQAMEQGRAQARRASEAEPSSTAGTPKRGGS